MVSRCSLLALILVLPSPASAQADPSPSLFTYGARGGVLLTSWDYTEGDEFFDRGTDFAVGGFFGLWGRGTRPLSLGAVVDVLYARQRVGDRIDRLAIQVDVQDGAADVVVFRCGERPRHVGDRADDSKADVGQHVARDDEEALVEEAPPYNRQNSAYINIPGPYEKDMPSIYYIAPPDPAWTAEQQAA